MSERRVGVAAHTLRAAIGRSIALDVAIQGALQACYASVGILDLRVSIPLTLVRALVWIVHLRTLMAPLSVVDRDAPLRDGELLAADVTAQTTVARFARAFAAGLVVYHVVLIALAALEIPAGAGFGDAELVVLSTVMVGIPVITSIVRTGLDITLLPLQTELAARLRARGIEHARAKTSVLRPIIDLSARMVVGVLVSMMGFVYLFHVRGVRAVTVVEAQRVVEGAVARAEAGLDVDDEGAEVLRFRQLPSWIQAELARGERDVGLAFHDSRRGVAVAVEPLRDGRWVLAQTEPDEEIMGVLVFAAISILAGIPLLIMGLWLSTRRLSLELAGLSESARRFVQHGELGELERTVAVRNDEIGELAANFNAMLDELVGLSEAAEAVARGQLDVTLDHPGALHDAFRGMLAQLSQTVSRLRETSLEVASAAGQIQALMQQQSAASELQASAVQQVSERVASLHDAAQSIASASWGVLGNAEQTVVKTKLMSHKITTLRDQTASIEELLELIREIAERSNLLALNGSLEATRAGEAGRGFALVAVEMRQLAERVSGVVSDVQVRVGDIEASGTSTVMATDDSRQLAQQTARAAAQISSFTTQQSGDTREVQASVEQLAQMVVGAARAMEQTQAAAKGLQAYAAELERLTGSFTLPR